MKLTENTKVRIKVPKHMYEAIQAELAKKSEMEEMAIPHDGHDKMKEDVEPVVTGVELTADKMGKLVGIDPTILGALIVGGIVAGTLKGPELVDVVKTSLQVALDKGQEKYNALKSYFKRKNVDTPEVGAKAEPVAEGAREGVYDDFAKWKASFPEGTEFAQENNYMMANDEAGKELGKWNPIQKQGMHADDFQYDNLEEALDLESLMEAVKDIAKKKAEAKKKKEAEDKKKADEKKKKEAEAKKKADAKKK